MTFPRLSLQTYVIRPVRWLFTPVRSLVQSLLTVLDLVLDELYWRWDLWSVPPTETTRGVADYSKVRGFWAFWGAIVFWTIVFATAKNIPSVIVLLAPISLLAYSMGERVFLAFIKALPEIIGHWKGAALAQGVVIGSAEGREKAVPVDE